jgi:hypothetical protein
MTAREPPASVSTPPDEEPTGACRSPAGHTSPPTSPPAPWSPGSPRPTASPSTRSLTGPVKAPGGRHTIRHSTANRNSTPSRLTAWRARMPEWTAARSITVTRRSRKRACVRQRGEVRPVQSLHPAAVHDQHDRQRTRERLLDLLADPVLRVAQPGLGGDPARADDGQQQAPGGSPRSRASG